MDRADIADVLARLEEGWTTHDAELWGLDVDDAYIQWLDGRPHWLVPPDPPVPIQSIGHAHDLVAEHQKQRRARYAR